MQSQDGGEGDASGGNLLPEFAEVSGDDDRFESRSTGGGERVEPRIHGGKDSAEMGLGHHLHRDVGRLVVLGGGAGLFTRKVVGWSMSERIDSRLAVDALEMAVSRQPPGAGLLAHSDRRVQYASEHYQRTLTAHGIACSVSRRAISEDQGRGRSSFIRSGREFLRDAEERIGASRSL